MIQVHDFDDAIKALETLYERKCEEVENLQEEIEDVRYQLEAREDEINDLESQLEQQNES